MDLDQLVISLLDSDAQRGLFKKELANKLNIPAHCLRDIWVENRLIDGVVRQYLYVLYSGRIKKENLMDLDFLFMEDSCIVFEIGDTVL